MPLIRSLPLNKESNTKLYERCVREFMTAFDQIIFPSAESTPIDVIKFRTKLIEEEWKEYSHAKTEEDKLDGLCDLIYVVMGTQITCSIPIEAYSTPIKTNFIHPFGPFAGVNCRDYLNNLHSLFPCGKHMYKDGYVLLCELDDTGAACGWDHVNAFKAVHENNMDKLWKEKPLDSTLIATPRGNRWLVKRSDGKVAKPADHIKVDLKPYLIPFLIPIFYRRTSGEPSQSPN